MKALVLGLLLWHLMGLASATTSRLVQCQTPTGIDFSTTTNTCYRTTPTSKGAVDIVALHGILKIEAEGSATTKSPNALVYGAATGIASFKDAFTIDAPGMQGRTGLITLKVLFDWDLYGSVGDDWPPNSRAKASASVSLNVSRNGAWVGVRTQKDLYERSFLGLSSSSVITSQDNNKDVPFDSDINATFAFTFGQPIEFEVSLGASAEASGLATARAAAGRSVYWGGIDGVTFQGQSINYTLTSSSGVDWSKSMAPVPEPSSWVVMLLGLLGLVLKQRLSEMKPGTPRRIKPLPCFIACVLAVSAPAARAQNYQDTQRMYQEQDRQRRLDQEAARKAEEQRRNQEVSDYVMQRDSERMRVDSRSQSATFDLMGATLTLAAIGLLADALLQPRSPSQPRVLSPEEQAQLAQRSRQALIIRECVKVRRAELQPPQLKPRNQHALVRLFQADPTKEYLAAMETYQAAMRETSPVCACVAQSAASASGFDEQEWGVLVKRARSGESRPWAVLDRSRLAAVFGACAAQSKSDPELSWIFAKVNR